MTEGLNRKEIEALIAEENDILHKCANLIADSVPIDDWPDEVRIAFTMAIKKMGTSKEAYKAFRTARHLRIDREAFSYPVPKTSTSIQERRAERIRADLPRLVRLGAGKYL